MKPILWGLLFCIPLLSLGQPKITSFTPTTGSIGTVVKITGSNLKEVSSVSFGGIAASFEKDSTNGIFINATVGAGASGFVVVKTNAGADSIAGFIYNGPRIFSFTPATGNNGTIVKITGENFTNASAVKFGEVTAKSFTVDSAKGITAVVGNGASGNISVVTANGIGTGNSQFTYTGPYINRFDPVTGAVGTVVKIFGSDFTGATAVKFGGVNAQSFTIDSARGITAVVGAGATGNVAVTTAAGTTSLDGFTFGVAPTITSFTPTSGKSGTTVTITGTNLSTTTSVSFGGITATSFQVVSATSITAVVGTGAGGSLSVTTSFGSAGLAGFTHIGPTITAFTPKSGNNGTTIKITGTNFTGTTAVSFGGIAAKSFTVDSAKGITAVVGAGTSGNISITTPNGTITIDGFTYTGPFIKDFSPKSATTGAAVKITGINLTGATSVSFGVVAAKSFTIDSTGITALVGTGGASGTVTVVTPNGSSSLAGFTYLLPPPIISYTGATSFCSGGSLLLTSSAATNNQWYKNGVALTAADTAKTYLITNSGTYSVVKLTNGVASALAGGIVVKVNPLPVAGFSVNNAVQCFREHNFIFANKTTIPNDTANKASYLWNFGDSTTSTRFDPSYKYRAPGTYTVKMFVTTVGGCKDSAKTNVTVNPSPTINKPLLYGFEKDSLLCFFDSVIVSSKDSYDKYLWSTGDTTALVIIRSSKMVSLKIGTKDPVCYSDSSVRIDVRKNITPKPTISRTGDNLISSQSNAYKWSLNNKTLANEITGSISIPAKGFYNVSTSADKVCWNTSKDFTVLTDPATAKHTYSIYIFPNPSNGIFTVQAKFEKITSAVINVTLTSTAGILRWSIKRAIISDKTIKMPVRLNLDKGIYTLKVEVNGEVNTQQIVIL